MEGFGDWFSLLAGIVLTVVGAVSVLRYLAWQARAERVPGIVARLTKEVGYSGSGGAFSRHPVLRFTTLAGQEVRARVKVGSNPPLAREGQRVTVVYDPRKPTEAVIEGKGWIQLLLYLVMTGLGVLFVGLAIS